MGIAEELQFGIWKLRQTKKPNPENKEGELALLVKRGSREGL